MTIGRIRRLPEALINKIAAGEVVERPASVVKELVENALDADARAITVELRDGGATLVRVTDDGFGMSAEELALALERHATSKLATDEDLDAIATLGFRGEAVPAICAVSRFTVTTRARGGGQDGTRVAGEGGAITQRLGVACDAGTAVEVRDLFFNTPARLKFLKAGPTEVAASLRVITQLAVAQPEVQFRAISNGRAALTAPRAADLRERLGAIWGYDVAGRLLQVQRDEHGITVHGWVSPPDLTRGGREEVMLAVNGRPVRDPTLFQAVLAAYRPLLPRDRFPFVAVSIALPAADVDANVHPTKAWVRFRHPRLVQEMLVAAVGAALRRDAVMPSLRAPESPAAAASAPATAFETGAPQPALFAETPTPYTPARFGRVLGQVQDTFIVAANDEEVFFLDQHVAHERVLFERLQAELASGPLTSQTLLFPQPLELAPAARALLERWRPPLERLGFALEGFGGEAVLLRAVPVLLKGDEPRRVIEAALDELAGPKVGEPTVDRALAFVACRAAIKANTELAREEMERLVADLGATATPFFCPHGRPVVSRISLADVRKELKRTW
ncbi:MAG: DNA mismatch repair endonuclease MutL [Candidatus Rokubacteria bacterium]|nr:DNA mismatch repair endonuclease MutL [Candidatus Rokubacteria bacterium]